MLGALPPLSRRVARAGRLRRRLLPARRSASWRWPCCRPSCASSTTRSSRAGWRGCASASRRAASGRRGRRRPELNAEQAAALARDRQARAGHAVLLHGVTGSGKTEVYLRAAERSAGAPAARCWCWCPRSTSRRSSRRASPSASPGRRHRLAAQRADAGAAPAPLAAAHLGRADLVLGTRLAVFASLPRLGLIVVDEEHDPSYKQQEGARYSARDLAVYRGHLRRRAGAARLGHAVAGELAARRAGPLPAAGAGRSASAAARCRAVRLVDMNQLPRDKRRRTALSPPLLDALQRAHRRAASRAWCFLNRRGYAPVLHCGACGWKSGCPHCSAWRVFHKLDRTLRCHHCGFTERVPRACPDCGNLDIAPLGRGTERLEEQLAALLPRRARRAHRRRQHARCKGALEAQLGAVHAGEVDVLVGTQMVTKGHDFRRITLVAAVNPDSALFSSDFRAAERLFALLMQAGGPRRARRRAGRAQRDVGADLAPAAPAVRGAARARLRGLRRAASSPSAQRPACRRSRTWRCCAPRRAAPRRRRPSCRRRRAGRRAARTRRASRVYPPVPLPVARVADVERMQMLVESASRPALQRLLAAWLPALHALRARSTRACCAGRSTSIRWRSERAHRAFQRRGRAGAARPWRAGFEGRDTSASSRVARTSSSTASAQVGRAARATRSPRAASSASSRSSGVEVAIEQRQRLAQSLRVAARISGGKKLHRGGEAGHPGVDGFDVGGRRIRRRPARTPRGRTIGARSIAASSSAWRRRTSACSGAASKPAGSARPSASVTCGSQRASATRWGCNSTPQRKPSSMLTSSGSSGAGTRVEQLLELQRARASVSACCGGRDARAAVRVVV